LGEWAVDYGMKINPCKRKAIRFTGARVKNSLVYSPGVQIIPEASSCKFFFFFLQSNCNWVDKVNYRVQKAWTALHFVMRVLKEGIMNTKSLAYTSLVRPIL
jgi:hypothetical protein